MYKLTEKELNNLDNLYKFIDLFLHPKINGLAKNWFDANGSIFGAYEYRIYIRNIISNNILLNDFYMYEKILNKLLWNLFKHIKFNILNITKSAYVINNITDEQKINTKNKYKRSYSHKIWLKDTKKNISYFFKDYPKLLLNEYIQKIFTVMCNKELYENIMNNKENINNVIPLQTYYYPYDYPFPNINLLFYNRNNKKIWINKIQKLYYNKDNSAWYEGKDTI